MGPKMYAYQMINKFGQIITVMKAKGIPKKYLTLELYQEREAREIKMPRQIKKVGYKAPVGRQAFSVHNEDRKRTFYLNEWARADFDPVSEEWFPLENVPQSVGTYGAMEPALADEV